MSESGLVSYDLQTPAERAVRLADLGRALAAADTASYEARRERIASLVGATEYPAQQLLAALLPTSAIKAATNDVFAAEIAKVRRDVDTTIVRPAVHAYIAARGPSFAAAWNAKQPVAQVQASRVGGDVRLMVALAALSADQRDAALDAFERVTPGLTPSQRWAKLGPAVRTYVERALRTKSLMTGGLQIEPPAPVAKPKKADSADDADDDGGEEAERLPPDVAVMAAIKTAHAALVRVIGQASGAQALYLRAALAALRYDRDGVALVLDRLAGEADPSDVPTIPDAPSGEPSEPSGEPSGEPSEPSGEPSEPSGEPSEPSAPAARSRRKIKL